MVCLSTDPLNLWDNDSGIYVMGPNASPDSPFFGANFWQDWERPANMEVYDINGIKQVDQGVGIRIYGSYSRANAQKSLAVYARSEYGKGSFDYSFFKDKPITSYESIVLRNSGNDWNGSVMRDGIASELVKGMDVERQAFQPSIVYINGAYWGILNMREKINSYFIAENHFVDPAKVNILEGNGTVTEGSNADYLPIISYLNVNTLESEEKYLKATEHIDINNYIQYQLSEIYLNNKDWPGNNIKFWNTNDPDFHWRWILYDTDFGLNLWESIAYTYNTLEFALDPSGPGWPNPPWATLMFRRMVTNPDFRYNFITQFADRLNTNFESKRAVALVDSVKNLFMPEIDMHLARWGMDFNFWYGQVGNIKSFVNYRAGYMRNFLRSQFGLGITMNVKIIISSPGAGKVLLNTVIPNVYPFTGVYFQNLPIKLTALPADGYKFVRWEGSINSNAVSVDYDMSASPTITAVFEPASASDVNIVINEINYDSSPDKDTRDWIELYNAGIASVNLKNWVISDGGIETGFKFPNDLILYPDNYLVVAREMSAFRAVRPEISNLSGDFGFGLGNAGDDINLFNSNGNIEDWVNYTNNSPWPSGANATGASIELVNPLADNNIGSNWKLSSSGGTPGAINANSFPLEIPENIKDEKSLLDCFPNPFSDYTTVRIVVPGAADYKLEVYDLQGRLIKVLADEFISAGTYYIDWEGKDSNNSKLPGGFYIIRLSGFNQVMNLKVILTR
ncbi:MAG: CotH kinase family protein [Bacteroidales bacterium]|nr:CotH kinase family protein [Bacteroidales bacterium]